MASNLSDGYMWSPKAVASASHSSTIISLQHSNIEAAATLVLCSLEAHLRLELLDPGLDALQGFVVLVVLVKRQPTEGVVVNLGLQNSGPHT